MLKFNKIILYTSLIIIYLGLSKAISPTALSDHYVFNNESLKNLSKEKPLSIILVDTHSTGFAIKTHYHKYRIVYGFKSYQEIIVKVSSAFKQRHEADIGASIFQRDYLSNESFQILIPGAIFIGDKVFGDWIQNPDGTRIWSFNRLHRHLKDYLGWQKFTPQYSDYQQIQLAINQKTNFLGKNNEFGTEGFITKESFKTFYKRQSPQKINFEIFVKEYFKENFYKSKVSI